MKICCFTGHRILPDEDARALPDLLRETVSELVEEKGFTVFRAGGALGFDTLAAEAVLAVRDSLPAGRVRLELILPHPDQAKRWSWEDRRVYEDILARADGITYAADHYHAGCMHLRNRMLVNDSSLCVSYVTKREGGSYYTGTYAQEKGVSVLNLARVLRDRRKKDEGAGL